MMNRRSDSRALEGPGRGAPSRGGGWWTSLGLGLGLLLVYSLNDRDLNTDDTLAATLMPLSLARGDGFRLDRFSALLRVGNAVPPHAALIDGRIFSRYPVATALVAMPLMVPQIARLDLLDPRWESDPLRVLKECQRIAKWSATLVVVLAAVILHRLLLRSGLCRGALPAVVAAFLGSDLWPVASQALWQHGPAALALTVALASMTPTPVPPWRLVLAGAATTILFSVRLMDAILAAAIVAWIARMQPRGLSWFLPLPIVGALLLLGYNYWYFGHIIGGQAQLEALHSQVHGVRGTWSSRLVEGATGTLVSPNRGLLIFSPWIAVALGVAIVPAVARRVSAQGPISWIFVALVPYLLVLSKYSVWWGGHCFGARYWTDVMPLFAILLAIALEWTWTHSRALLAFSYLMIAISIFVHGVGAFCYPSSWNRSPANVDRHHERLWDWRDTELSRCLLERIRGRQ